MTTAEITAARATALANLTAAEEAATDAQTNLAAAQAAYAAAEALTPTTQRYFINLGSFINADGLTTAELIVNGKNVSANVNIPQLLANDVQWSPGNTRYEILTPVEDDQKPAPVFIQTSIEDPGTTIEWDSIE